jgi:2-(1,2-epoxy-1,2-dihydrophenyl)acetyl-CoA isomerase
MNADDELLTEQRGSIYLITLNRPRALNALTMEMLARFNAEWDRLQYDDSVRVVIITGAGRGFCSGIDLGKTDFNDPRSRPVLDFGQQWVHRIRQLNKPTIAAVNGVAAGGGLGLALGCDIRIAAEEARFSAIFANIGMPALDGVGALLPQVVGVSRALEMIYTAEIIDAREAERIGLVSRVVPGAELLDRTLELAERIAAGPPMALAMSKFNVYQSLNRPFPDTMVYQTLGVLMNRIYAAHDIAEGTRAFRERRKPQFRGPGAPPPAEPTS